MSAHAFVLACHTGFDKGQAPSIWKQPLFVWPGVAWLRTSSIANCISLQLWALTVETV